ncbi:MAG: hypothetical protein IJ537_00680 [Bacteroidaceae bacterium]|nr:hypothetical protein [Bacteroidaceae bacterium]
MSEQAFPLDGFEDLESGVKSITQKAKPTEQPKPQMQQAPKDASVIKKAWQHFTVILAVEIVDKVKTIAHNEGFSIREVVEKFLSDGIVRYERKHGAVERQTKNINDIL